MLAAAALLASCSQDDALQSTVNNNEGLKPMTITASLPTDGMQTRAAGDEGLKPMTITASLPTDGMQTRAAGDEAAARCYMQILNGNGTELAGGNSKPIPMDPVGDSFTTTVYLNGTNTYDFLFWADTETTNADQSNAPADLRAVEYTNGKTIAWAGNDLDKMWDADGVSVTLIHVVSRVTVITTSDFAGSETWPFIVTVPTVYSKYNVETGKVVEDSEVPGGYILNVTDGEYEQRSRAFSRDWL